MKKRKPLELGHFERIAEQCKHQSKFEQGGTYLTRYILNGEDKSTLLIDKESGSYTEIVSRDGCFSDFPGIEYNEEWQSRFEYNRLDHSVKFGAYIVKLSDDMYRFLWIIQPDRFEPGDSEGYGMDAQPEIRLYAHFDRSGRFSEPFRLYSIGGQGYFQDPQEDIRVIFLDFDGVLNSESYLTQSNRSGIVIDPTRMELLRKIISATNARIVLSTSWRSHWSIIPWMCNETGQEINRVFENSDLYIYDKTPERNHNRYEEITQWLRDHSQVKNFVVLDDEPFEEGLLRDHFILTSRLRRGLDEDDVKKP